MQHHHQGTAVRRRAATLQPGQLLRLQATVASFFPGDSAVQQQKLHAAGLKLPVGVRAGILDALKHTLQPRAAVVIARQKVDRHAQATEEFKRSPIVVFPLRVVVYVARMKHKLKGGGQRLDVAQQGPGGRERGRELRPHAVRVRHQVRIAEVDEGQGLHAITRQMAAPLFPDRHCFTDAPGNAV